MQKQKRESETQKIPFRIQIILGAFGPLVVLMFGVSSKNELVRFLGYLWATTLTIIWLHLIFSRRLKSQKPN